MRTTIYTNSHVLSTVDEGNFKETCIRLTDKPCHKVDLNKKSLPKQKTIQNFTIDAQGFRKTKNENPSTWEIETTS